MKTFKYFETGFATKREVNEALNNLNTSKIIDGEVNTYADLPAPANHNGEIWIVKTTTGVVFVNKKFAGLYISNGATWTILSPVEINDLEQIVNKDATGGYAGLTLFKINFKNALNTFTSFLTNSNTTSRTYVFPDVNGTVITTGDTGTITSSMIANNISTEKLQQTTINQTKTQPVNNDSLNVIVDKLLGLNNTGSSLAPLTIGNLASGGVIGTAENTVDINNVFLINQTTVNKTITFPNPTNATLSQVITIKANSTASLIAYGCTIYAGGSKSFLWNGLNWSPIGSSLSYMTGFNANNYMDNLFPGDHLKFDSIHSSRGDDITLDVSTPYTTMLNVASVGRITLKAGKTYSIWGCINNAVAIGLTYGAHKWVNANTGEQLSLVSGGSSPVATTDRISGVGAFCFFSPTVDTAIELQFHWVGVNFIHGAFDAIGPSQFHIQTI